MRMLRWTALAIAGALAAVMVSPMQAQSVDVKPQQQKIKRDKNVLTAEEIAERPEIINAYDAVKLLRSHWLRAVQAKGGAMTRSYGAGQFTPDPAAHDPRVKGSSESPPPSASTAVTPGGGDPENSTGMAVLYVDDVRQESLKQLENLPVASLVQLKYMGASEASGRYGSGHEAGAILVTTQRLGKP